MLRFVQEHSAQNQTSGDLVSRTPAGYVPVIELLACVQSRCSGLPFPRQVSMSQWCAVFGLVRGRTPTLWSEALRAMLA
jgi:hypothetical protein